MAPDLFTQADLDRLSACIQQAELQSSGEIRVHLEKHCRGNALDRARTLFHQLGMDRTELRNGVLIYVATQDRKVSILGDEGIHHQVTDQFWSLELENLLELMKLLLQILPLILNSHLNLFSGIYLHLWLGCLEFVGKILC